MQSLTEAAQNDVRYLQKFLRRYKKRVIAVLVVVVLLLVDVTMVGSMRYYGKWIDCGYRPIVGTVLHEFKKSDKPYYFRGTVLQPFNNTTHDYVSLANDDEYFCSEVEAERAGYSYTEYHTEFQHIDPSEAKTIDR